MSLSVNPTRSVPRPSIRPTHESGLPSTERAVLAVVARSCASDVHDLLATELPGRSIRTWTCGSGPAVVDELAHRDMVRFARRGAVLGAIVLGAVTVAAAVWAAEQSFGVGAGLGSAVALTGGVFFGALMGFFMAVLRWEDAHASVRSHGRRGELAGVVIVEGELGADEVRDALEGHDATLVGTGLTGT